MKKILVDTNIVIDLLAKREPFYEEAAELFSLADNKEISLMISSLSIANTNYILSQYKLAKDSREILRKFKVLVDVLNLDDKVVSLALSDEEFTDFEDGLQYYFALENGVDILLTRNKKDFKNSKIPILTAKEYLSLK